MSTYDPVELLFGGMEKLGPGGNEHTLHVLRLLPQERFDTIVDAGCGAGRQTMVLARELDTVVQAVDVYEPFLTDLRRRANNAQLAHLVKTTCMDMADIPARFSNIDLLWSEGSAYSIGFAHALAVWAHAIRQDGFAVVSELCWLGQQAPDAVKGFFQAAYPSMQSVVENIAVAESAGYKVLNTYALPRAAWVEDYYEILEPRARTLVAHPDSSVRDFALETLEEIETFAHSPESYGYVFFLLRRV